MIWLGTTTRLPLNQRWAQLVSALALTASVVANLLVALDAGPTTQIIAGARVGPVRLGMAVDEATAAARAFQRSTGCQIDLLIDAERVVAAGTRFGGCLELSIPKRAPVFAKRIGSASVPVGAWILGPASAFIAVFGNPIQVLLVANRSALIWPQGLAAYVSDIHDGDGTVTYLAVIPPRCTALPAIGYLQDFAASEFELAVSHLVCRYRFSSGP